MDKNKIYPKYQIRKLVEHPGKLDYSDRSGGDRSRPTYSTKTVDPDAEYFVLRLDDKSEDIKAARIAIHAYADAVSKELPGLASRLKNRYPLI